METVGVGQSETDVADVCDTVAVVVQPASGDVLQFLKAGIMEVPDVLVVTKATWATRRRAPGATWRRRSRRSGRRRRRSWPSPRCHRPAASTSWAAALDEQRRRIDLPERRLRLARVRAAEFIAEHGERALRELGGRREAERLSPRTIRASA